MMTIKDFAALCGCSAQTLRYYDRIGLLKPDEVDAWTSYRYYEAGQAIDFVKIKNLQAADFSIEEIKSLLMQSDEEVYAAFDAKIAAQKDRLARIIEIQKSYLSEKNGMEKIISSMSDFILGQLSNFEGLREFGLSPEDGPRVVEHIRNYMESQFHEHISYPEKLTLTVNDEVIRGADEIAERIRSLDKSNLADTITLNDSEEEPDFSVDHFDSIWQADDWEHVHEFIDDIPPLEPNTEYCFNFLLAKEQADDDISFPMFMLGAMTLKKGHVPVTMGCSCKKSSDGKNHFALLRKK